MVYQRLSLKHFPESTVRIDHFPVMQTIATLSLIQPKCVSSAVESANDVQRVTIKDTLSHPQDHVELNHYIVVRI